MVLDLGPDDSTLGSRSHHLRSDGHYFNRWRLFPGPEGCSMDTYPIFRLQRRIRYHLDIPYNAGHMHRKILECQSPKATDGA